MRCHHLEKNDPDTGKTAGFGIIGHERNVLPLSCGGILFLYSFFSIPLTLIR
jgi:hypothetical protein